MAFKRRTLNGNTLAARRILEHIMTEEKKKSAKTQSTESKPIEQAAEITKVSSSGWLSKEKERVLEHAIAEAGIPFDRVKSQLIEAMYPSVMKSVDISSFLLVDPHYSEFQQQLASLRNEVSHEVKAVSEEADSRKKEKQIRALKEKLKKLSDKQSLNHLLNRVGTAAQSRLLSDPSFRSQFSRDEPCDAFVMSIDIRRSTELMLKAREPKLFAAFITSLASQLREIVLSNYGIFDKFTGDGILAFFPDFYSGDDSGFRAVQSALQCHELFRRHFELNRKCFLAVLKDIGLGIGLDFGKVQLVEIGGDFSVVGTPVVYACRMAGAPAGKTYANQPAYESLFENYSVFDFEETYVDIKHEGQTLAYSIRANGKNYLPRAPSWVELPSPENKQVLEGEA